MKRTTARRRYRIRTALGTFVLTIEGRRILGVEMGRSAGAIAGPLGLRRAFEGALAGRPLRGWSLAHGGSPLERSVWRQLRRIPYGITVSYTQIARAAGRPRAVRAVASAIGRNPLPVLVPCHRVIRKGGDIGGYAGPLRIKKGLLALERVRAAGRRG